MRLSSGSVEALNTIKDVIGNLVTSPGDVMPNFTDCPYLNMSICESNEVCVGTVTCLYYSSMLENSIHFTLRNDLTSSRFLK